MKNNIYILSLLLWSNYTLTRERNSTEQQNIVEDQEGNFNSAFVRDGLLVDNIIKTNKLIVDQELETTEAIINNVTIIDADITNLTAANAYINNLNVDTLNVSGTSVVGCDVFVDCNLYIPETTSSSQGIIFKYSGTTAAPTISPFLHNAGTDCVFLGKGSGNFIGGNSNVGIGQGSLANVINTSFNNTAVGWATLNLNTGNNNTAIGNAALLKNTSGSTNTAVGNLTLNFNTSGSNNTAVGHGTLYLNTIGGQNTAIGLRTLRNNTTGNQNTALGYEALINNNSGTNNIAIGINAGSSINNTNNNIDIGNTGTNTDAGVIRIGTTGTHIANFQAGVRGVTAGVLDTSVVSIDTNGQLGTGIITNNINLTGSTSTEGVIQKNGNRFLSNPGIGNTFLGENGGVLDPAFIGTNNTSVGARTLQNLTGNTRGNTAIGFGSSILLETGNFNTALGGNALTNVVTGSGNVGLGFNAGTSYVGGESNNIIIGFNVNGLAGDSGVVRIGRSGTHTTNFQAGIRNVTAANLDTSVVSIDTNGQLGTGIITNNINLTGSTPFQGNILKNGLPFISNPGTSNTFIGLNSGLLTISGTNNTSIGESSLSTITTGTNNIAIGYNAGNGFTIENNNIDIGNTGTLNDNGVIRIGTSGTHVANFQAGIRGITAGVLDTSVVSIDSNGQLGTGIITNNINLTGSTTTQGNILKNGTLFLHNTGPDRNTFLGLNAGNTTTTGDLNTGIGGTTLLALTSGDNNTAVGVSALRNNTTGSFNTAIGVSSLLGCTTGSFNVGVGQFSLLSLTGGSDNIAIGRDAGSNIVGSNNICIGNTGQSSDNGIIRIGFGQTRNIQSGIFGSPAVGTSAIYINAAGEISTTTSSAQYKENIHSLPSDTLDKFKQLHPVSFNYINDESHATQYGFIAENVALLLPELIVYNIDGSIYSIKYQLMYALLYAWLQNIQQKQDTNVSLLNAHEEIINTLRTDLQNAQSLITALAARVVALENILNS